MPKPENLGDRHSRVRPIVLLALDDDLRARFAYELVAFGFEVALFDRGASDHTSGGPDIIVLELSTEGEGQWSARMFHRETRFRGVPVVGVATDTSPTTRDRAQREGCAAVCLATCSADVLAMGLRALLDGMDVRNGTRSQAHG